MMKKGKSRVLYIYYICLFICLLAGNRVSIVEASEHKVPVDIYEFGDNNYDSSNSDYKVDNMSFGSRTLGMLSLLGHVNEISTYNNRTAYGLEDGMISFNYAYNGNLLDDEDKYLCNDKTNIIDNFELDSKIAKGALIILKSYDGKEWNYAANPVVNFYEDNPEGVFNFYTTKGEDVKKGCYYKIMLAYMTTEKTGESEWLFWDETIDIRHLEVYNFYICQNSANISIHNLSVDENDIKEVEGYSLNSLIAGETMLDGSTTYTGFKVDKLGAYYSVKVNGIETEDGTSFVKDGKYDIVVETDLGKTKTYTIYVFNGGNDKGYGVYFGEDPFVGERIFSDNEYPTYTSKTCFKTNKLTHDVPYLRGNITNLDTGESINLKDNDNVHYYSFSPGLHIADLYSGNTDSGSIYNYVFMFYISDKEQSHPVVNQNTLMNSERLCDLESKYYQVVYQTTGGGYISVCFTDYDKAFGYAYDIEKRFIEWSDGILYYKSEDNPNVKVGYKCETNMDKINLTRIINQYARQNVEVAYINAKEEYTYQTIAETEEKLLDCLEAMSIKNSIKVFSDEKEKALAISRVPYINGYKFMHVADYDVKTVQALCKENEEITELTWDRTVDEQLDVSSIYTIIETNEYGRQTKYDVSFMKENQTCLTLRSEGESFSVSSKNDGEIIKASSVLVADAYNKMDDQAILKISSPTVYEYPIVCKVNELAELALTEAGEYTITFVDRVGNSYSIIVDITGGKCDGMSYKEFYNNIYIGDK